jgi:hypothetical protein
METLVQPAGATYGIRYGIMLTAKPTNLLVPGRAISADRMMQGSLRVMPPCLAMGQAAGTAAALSLRKKTPLARLDIEELRKVLEKQGARLQ